jgi:hypothetical protein
MLRYGARMVRYAWLLVLLAACPPKSSSTGPQQPQQLTGPGCPAASDVYLASYMTQEKGRSGWVLPLHAMKVEPASQVPDYQPLDPAAASVSGVPQGPTGNLWLVAGNAAPCQVKLGGHYAAKVDGPPAGLSYGIELDGCPAPTDPQEGGGVVLVSQEAPTGCMFESPRPVAARLGQMNPQKQWTRPTQATPIPPALAAAIPPHDCAAPACEQLWAIAEVDVQNQPVVWSGAVNWLATGDPAQTCQWKAERFSGFFVPGPDGKPVRVSEGQEHPLPLSAALVDRSGAHVLLAEGPGEYATYDVVPGKATLGHHVTWMFAPEVAWDMVDHLGPLCEPEPAKPAPLPKDAKPQSPYP